MSGSNIASILDQRERKNYRLIRKQWTIKSGDIFIGMLVPWVFLLFAFFLFWITKELVLLSVFISLLGCFYLSFWKKAYTAYFHEAAHYNLNKSKKMNDLLATICLTPFVGLWIDSYRSHHWKHHKYLGTDDDTEISYVKPISMKNIMYSFAGIYLIESIKRYLSVAKTNIGSKHDTLGSIKFFSGISFMLIIQGIIILLMYNFISPYLALTWAMSMLITDPFFEKVRQTLEHRNGDKRYKSRSTMSDGLAVNHIFGVGFFSRYFGSAGFNRHLLHHLDPSISSTRFDEFEQFLMGSSCADMINTCRSSYWEKFKELFCWHA